MIYDQDAGTPALPSSRYLSELGAASVGVVHDLHNLFAAILTNSELLQMASNQEEMSEYASDVQKGLLQAQELTNNLLTFVRLEEQQAQIIDVETCIKEVCEVLNPSLGEGIKLETTFPEAPISLQAHRADLLHIILNLILNARDAIEGEGSISIHLRTEEIYGTKQCVVEVKDSGAGIDSDKQKSVFTPFFSTKGEKSNSGLGLYIVRSTVIKLQGRIQLTSPCYEGHGTCFTIFLPLK